MIEPPKDIQDWVARVQAAESAEVTHMVTSSEVWAGLLFDRPPMPWKRRSIRAARRARGRMRGVKRVAERKTAVYRTDATPYLEYFMNGLDDPAVKRTVIYRPSRVGFTCALMGDDDPSIAMALLKES